MNAQDPNTPPALPSRLRSPDVALRPTDLNAEDRDFMARVFNQVKDVDFRSPPPPPTSNLGGVDKKMADLRDRVRKLERDLARVAYVWSLKNHEIANIDEILDAKNKERNAAIAGYQQLKSYASKATASYQEELAALRHELVQLQSARDMLTQDLQAARQRIAELEQERANNVVDFRTKMESAHNAFQQLQAHTARMTQHAEATIRDQAQEIAQLKSTLAATQVTLQEREQAVVLIQDKQRKQAMEAEINHNDLATARGAIRKLESRLHEREATMNGLLADLGRAKNELEKRVREAQDNVRQREGELTRRSQELHLCQSELRQLAESYERRRAEILSLEGQLARAHSELERKFRSAHGAE